VTEKFSVDITGFALDAEREAELFEKQNECVFMWSTRAGEPVGVVMCYMVMKGRFWLCLTADRVRVAAVRRDPRSAICISSAGTDMKNGKAISYDGDKLAASVPGVTGGFTGLFA
jgi:hypothetical protein